MDYKRLTNNNRDEYDPEYDFAKGINLAIDWYKENL